MENYVYQTNPRGRGDERVKCDKYSPAWSQNSEGRKQ